MWLTFLGASCLTFGVSPDQATLNVLESAITSLNNDSAHWENIATTALTDLPKNVQSTIKVEVEQAVTTAISATGQQIRCNTDFIGLRLAQAFERIVAKLKNTPPPAVVPAFCDVNPANVDMSLDPSRRTEIKIGGYDFVSSPPFNARLVDSAGASTDVSTSVTKQTPYAATINLGQNGIPLNRHSEKIQLLWDGTVVSEIPVIQPNSPPCVVATDTTDRFTYGPFVPPQTAGKGNDFNGHGPHIHADTALLYDSATNEVMATINMTAEETGATRPIVARGTVTFPFYVPPTGWVVQSIPNVPSSIDYTDHTDTPDVFTRSLAELVGEWDFVGDTKGPDAGAATSVTVRYNPIRIIRRESTNCINAAAVSAPAVPNPEAPVGRMKSPVVSRGQARQLGMSTPR